MITVNGYVRTDKGKVRPINEDNFCVDRYFKAQEAAADTHSFTKRKHVMAGVFDGIGGEENGEVASFIAAKTMAMFDGRVPEGDWNKNQVRDERIKGAVCMKYEIRRVS